LSAGPRRRQDGHVADLQLAGDAVPIVDRLTSVPDVAPGHRILVRDEFIRGPLGGQPNPASTLVQVEALFRPGLLVEVDAVVAVPG
jgi:enamine deaminase RidA (YjgF/YER057c/UK114 family)